MFSLKPYICGGVLHLTPRILLPILHKDGLFFPLMLSNEALQDSVPQTQSLIYFSTRYIINQKLKTPQMLKKKTFFLVHLQRLFGFIFAPLCLLYAGLVAKKEKKKKKSLTVP